MDVVKVTAALCQQRRNMFRDREHLLFAYQALLYYAQQLLIKRKYVLILVLFKQVISIISFQMTQILNSFFYLLHQNRRNSFWSKLVTWITS